ncbi:hypothetical protein ACFPDQ_01605 [Pseudofrancisella aestuarii]|uniref:Uncharacterized protein n=1 Tax=Pseudofrancisella aestuarii TaxID=2670347 RepID=A0ABV9TA15_9GAMM|nr:hypothetical protein [Pseudofrancisella aestuarii]
MYRFLYLIFIFLIIPLYISAKDSFDLDSDNKYKGLSKGDINTHKSLNQQYIDEQHASYVKRSKPKNKNYNMNISNEPTLKYAPGSVYIEPVEDIKLHFGFSGPGAEFNF